ncbi:methylamine utilization protein MauJ [Zhongshania sp. BJYM1]|uniref:methylamine utilization protein MauJ n=1 Tax=Zhongshania aquatica TaxID=2965069 RepID=UPI0022B2EB56|nr:methylamine utilization protein MauJ [Marortus sp. BJYM1]
MKTPYATHIFGEEVDNKLRSRRGWLTAGVASSIPWPSLDVCVIYDGDEYFLRGSERDNKPSPPCITIACNDGEADKAIAKIYRFTSILSWYLGGYVDVSGYIWGSHPSLYGNPRTVYSSMGIAGQKSFNCNHMPIIEEENIRKALAFWREAKRLTEVHDSYAFLSYYKVIESQFSDSRKKVDWIAKNIERLTDRAAKRVSELRAEEIDVSRHLFDSGRCAVAHASLEGEIIDPDIPADRRRLSADLVVIEELARIYIRDELKVPDSMGLYRSRNRLEPWESIIPDEKCELLESGGTPEEIAELQDLSVSVGLWPGGSIAGLEKMTMHVDAISEGVVKIVLICSSSDLI